MNTTEKIQTYLNDPKIVSVNTVDAHSDHKYFESLAEFSEGEMKLRQSLNGKWKIHYAQNTNQVLKDFYKTEFDETDLNFINVPGHLELQGFGSPQYVNTQYPWDGKEFLRPPQVPQESNAVASYVKHFTLNDALKDKKVFISFQGVATSIFVWVNGNFVGYSEDSFTPSEFEISDYLVEGDNKLAVAVYRYSTASWLEDQDFWRLYGIFRDVYLYAIPRVHVQDLFVKADYDYQTKIGQLDIDLKTVGDYEDKKIKYVLSHHEGIVTKEEYETVQMLLAKDTRIAPGENRLYLFGGLLSCGDCGSNLIRRTNSYKGEKTVFYICSSYNKKKDQCSRHSIREDVLIQLVMDSLKIYSKMTDAIRSAMEYLKENSLDTQTLIQHDDQILELRNKVNKYYKLLHSLSGNLASGVISRDDYALLRERYQTEIKSLESNIEKQEEYMENLLENKLLCEEWVNTFLEKPSLGDLDRDMLLQYVEKINVFEGKKIEIVYRFQDELVTAARLAEQIGKTKQEVAV